MRRDTTGEAITLAVLDWNIRRDARANAVDGIVPYERWLATGMRTKQIASCQGNADFVRAYGSDWRDVLRKLIHDDKRSFDWYYRNYQPKIEFCGEPVPVDKPDQLELPL